MEDISVAICDDSALMRNLISRVIDETEGLSVAGKAMNGQFLVEKLSLFKPDVIVLDIEMPEMGGLDVLRVIRGIPEIAGLKVVFLTASNSREDLKDAARLHALQFVNLGSCTTNHSNGFPLSFADTCRRHLDTVNIKFIEQHTGNDEFLVWEKRYTAGLLTIAQGGIHDFHKRLNALVFTYLFSCSHCIVLSWFCTRKSISSRPFMRQCFL